MGFIHAISELGALNTHQGIGPYLELPLENGGKVIRVFLNIEDINAEQLVIKGIDKIDLADQISNPQMEMKYLYRKEVGSNVTWRFSPIHKMGKPKANIEGNKKDWIGKSGNWQDDKDSHLYKIQKRVLSGYEDVGTIVPGSTDLIMSDLANNLDQVLNILQGRDSHIVIFGGSNNGEFVYPGEIPALISYFEKKLQQSLYGEAQSPKGKQNKRNKKATTETGSDYKRTCSLCGAKTSQLTSISNVFKFATSDKTNFLPGLDEKRGVEIFAVCRGCFENISSGRKRVDSSLVNTRIIPSLRMWVIPEAVGANDLKILTNLIGRMESLWENDKLKAPGEKTERRMFKQLAREGGGLIFHFVFWERNNAQELVHLMVEDVPPERLAFLESKWAETMLAVLGPVERGLDLDDAIRGLYGTLSRFAGKSEADKIVFRDLSLRIIEKMLVAEPLPVKAYKKFVISRAARLVYENDRWDEVQRTLRYAQVWVEYMLRINRG